MRRQVHPNVGVLRGWPGLGGCSDRELAALAKIVEFHEVEAGRVLMREGEHAAEAFMIVSGTVEVEVGGEPVAMMGAGQIVGEMALLEHDVRSATVTARSDARVLVLSVRAFNQLASHSGVAKRLAAEMASRVRELEGGSTRRGVSRSGT